MTMKEQIDGLTAQIAAKDADIVAAKEAHDTAIKQMQAEHEAKLAGAAKTATELAAKVDAAQAETVAAKLETAAMQTLLATQTARAESAEAKLVNPAIEHASAKGVEPLKEVNAETSVETDDQFLAKYNAEPDAVKRTLMYQARQKLLQKS